VDGRSLGDVIEEMRGNQEQEDPSSDGGSKLRTTTQDRQHFLWIGKAVAGVADALHAAHAQGIVHRDVKPSNLLLTDDGTLKLVDFGLAYLEGVEASITRTGQILGTPHYMSPEQATAKRVRIDHRTDVYSLGATLYEFLTLRLPFTGDSLHEVCTQIATRDPAQPRRINPRIPRDLETVVQKAMEKDRDRRYQTAEEMAADLRRFSEGETILARRVGPVVRLLRKTRRHKVRVGLVSSLVLLALVVGLLVLRADRETRAREYDDLCGLAEDAVASSMDLLELSEFDEQMLPGETARDLYSSAIELLPGRVEAWFGRSLAPGRTLEQRLRDLDAARERGLSPRVVSLARAYVRRAAGDPGIAEEAALLSNLIAETSEEAFFLARLVLADGRREEARELLARVLTDADRSSAVHYLALRSRASLRRRTGDHAGALEDLHALLVLRDDSVEVRIDVARCWRLLGNREQSMTVLQEAIDEARRRASTPVWLRLCVKCRGVGRGWHIRATKAALAACPDDVDILLHRAFARRRDEGLACCRRAIEIDPENALAYRILGQVLRGQDRTDEAIDAFRRAAELDPDSAAIRCMLGQALAHAERYDEALAAHEAAVDLDPDFGMSHKGRGAMFDRLGRTEEAIRAYRRAIDLIPNYVMTHVRLWNLLKREGRPQIARREMERVAESGSPYLRAYALSELGRNAEALEAIEEAIRIQGRSSTLLESRAECLSALGRFEEAFLQYSEMKRLSRYGHMGRAKALLELGRFAEALRDFEAAMRQGDVEARAGRAFALASLGRFDEAGGALETVDDRDVQAEGVLHWQIHALMLMNRHEEAFSHAERLAIRIPDRAYEKARCLMAIKRQAEARRIAESFLGVNAGPCRPLPFAWLCVVAGEPERAKEILATYDRPWTPATLYERAAVQSILGDAEGAIASLEEAIDGGHRRPAKAPADRDFAPLAEDPRYETLLERVGRPK